MASVAEDFDATLFDGGALSAAAFVVGLCAGRAGCMRTMSRRPSTTTMPVTNLVCQSLAPLYEKGNARLRESLPRALQRGLGEPAVNEDPKPGQWRGPGLLLTAENPEEVNAARAQGQGPHA